MRYKAVISDLDGTLLNEHHTISEETKDVVKKLVEKGVKFMIATGRYYPDAMIFKDILGLESPIITTNGARIHDCKNEVVFSKDIPLSVSEELFSIECDEDIHRNVYIDGKWFVEKPLNDALKFHRESGFSYEIIDSFETLKGKEATKFFFISDNHEKLAEMEKRLRDKYSEMLSITMSSDNCIELMYEGVSKAEAIKEVLKREGISLEETIAFGDGLNDYEMLSCVGKGFIMGNGSQRLKQLLPNNEIVKSNFENGVAKKLKEIFLID